MSEFIAARETVAIRTKPTQSAKIFVFGLTAIFALYRTYAKLSLSRGVGGV